MATWEDGPEYAPLEPPTEFTVPDAPPLSEAPPVERVPDVPGARPQFGDPAEPVAPLGTLIPEEGIAERDPADPFDVDSDTMSQGGSTGSAWGAAHWRPPAGAPARPQPDQPMALQSGPAQQHANLPAPGTPGWFGPGPAATTPTQRPDTVWKAVPTSVLILLGVSVLWFCAPFTYLAAFILSSRLQYARKKVLTAFGVVFGAAVLIATAGTLLNYGGLGEWYRSLSTWSLLGSIVMFILVLVLVNNDLRPRPGPPPYQR